MQSPASPPWDDVRIFLALMREGTLGGAARRLTIDASTVSRRLAALEHRLGGALFERTREGLAASARAEQLLPAAEEMEAGLLHFTRGAAEIEARPEGVVRVTAPPGIADLVIAPRLGELYLEYPRLQVVLDASVRVANLTRQEADVAVRTVPSEGAQLVTQKLLTTRWVLGGAPALVKKLGRLRSWDDAPYIDWADDLGHLAAARWLQKRAPKALRPLRTSHFGSQLAAAEAGLGLLLVVEPYFALRPLVPALLSPPLANEAEAWPEEHAWLVTHRALRSIPRVAAVWNFLRRVVALPAAKGPAAKGPAAKTPDGRGEKRAPRQDLRITAT